MAKCVTKNFARTKICRGDFRNKIQIRKREQGTLAFDEIEPLETFSLIASPFAAIETVAGVARFAGINIDERATHIFNIVYTSFLFSTISLDNLEQGNYFVRFKGRNYRILKLTNINEDNKYIAIQTTERGAESLEASKA